MDNRELAETFDRIGDLLEIKGEVVYKVLAYRRAAESIRSQSRAVADLWREDELRSIPGVGEALATKIDELMRTGKLDYFEKLKREVPVTLVDVLRVGDVGPKKAARFWKELGIQDLPALEAAARDGRLQRLRGMGERSEARILKSIEALKARQTSRVSIARARPVAESLLERLRFLPGVAAAEAAGSLRRCRETVGDIDLLVAARRPQDVIRAFLSFDDISRVRGQGDTKASVEMASGLAVQLWVHPPEHFGTALQYATGSQAHNVRLRELAQSKGLSLSEHGFKQANGSIRECDDEVEVYRLLGLPWIPPELREDRGEVEAALEGRLPDLITQADIHGELHAHTDWSDGAATLEEMAEAAAQAGLDYLVITDHSRSLGVANGLTPERVRQQRRKIDALQKKIGGRLRLLHGTEVEILADGRLDFPDDVLAAFDLVTASVHSSLRQSRGRVTSRMLAAIRHPHVDIIGHLTGRMIGTRDPADLDLEAVFQAAAEQGVALEINAHPDRLDLNEAHARRATELGCLLAINTDAHRPEHFALRAYGIGIARRGWVTLANVVNSWDVDQVLRWARGHAR
ncbi:MAG: DNA polymerase/3'-5' exonuclease PolX [Chloroflexi bacterium]|nr:DNA polymerase/3'-5' exonuclease PolX [Chloroflexota bacterium]